MVTVQVQVVASFCTGSPSPGTTGPLTVISTSQWAVSTFTGRPSTVSAGLDIVPTSSESTEGRRVFPGRNDGYLEPPPPPHPARRNVSAAPSAAAPEPGLLARLRRTAGRAGGVVDTTSSPASSVRTAPESALRPVGEDRLPPLGGEHIRPEGGQTRL